MYPQVKVEEYAAEGGMLVSCYGAATQEAPGRAPALLEPFCQAWESFVTSKGKQKPADSILDCMPRTWARALRMQIHLSSLPHDEHLKPSHMPHSKHLLAMAIIC